MAHSDRYIATKKAMWHMSVLDTRPISPKSKFLPMDSMLCLSVQRELFSHGCFPGLESIVDNKNKRCILIMAPF